MPKIKKTAKNIGVLFAGDIFNRLIGFLAVAYLARILGASDFGLISIGLAFLSYSVTISSNGLPMLGVREVVKSENDNELVGDFITARFVFSLIVIFLIIIISCFIKSSVLRSIILAYSLYLFPAVLLLDWYFQAKERMGLIVSVRAIGMIFYLFFILIFIKTNKDIIYVPYCWFIRGLVTSLCFILIYVSKGNRIEIKLSFHRVKNLFLKAFPLGLAGLIAQITLYLPPIFLGFVMSPKETGFYSVAARIVFLFLILDRVFSFSFFPAISKCVSKTPERLNNVFSQTLKWIVIIVILFGFSGIVLGKYLVLFVFGEEYLCSIPVFHTVMSYFMITLINSVFTFTLIALKQEKAYTLSLFIGSLVFLALAWILLKIFGSAGMGIGLGIYQAVSLVIMNNKLKNFLEIKFWKIVVLPLIVSIVIFLPLIFIIDLHIIFKVLVILICMIPISLLIGLKREELKFLMNKIV
ncbi:MAG: flippase [Candidatus Cloacimonetes bacterium]|nr:flippase [Candidatus Cloacimonadota bacterium]